MELFGYWRSSCTWRVRLVLAYKGLSYDVVPVHLLKDGGEQKSAVHRARSPLSQVPALRIGDEVFSQSLAIISYLEDIYPAPSVLPDSPASRARMFEIAEMINAGIQPLQNLEVMQRLSSMHGLSPEDARAFAKGYIERGLMAVEQRVSGSRGRFCVGDAFSVADACLLPQLYNARRFDIDLAPLANLLEVEQNLLGIEVLQAAHPDAQPDAQP